MAVPNLHFIRNRLVREGCYHGAKAVLSTGIIYKLETLEDSFVLVIISASGRLELSVPHRAAVPAGRDDRGCRETRTLRS
jgi:hypothetical protein